MLREEAIWQHQVGTGGQNQSRRKTGGTEEKRDDQAPHEWLFPRMRAVVHHGGAGTTAAGLRSGKPNVVIPYFADQHFWGSRVRQLGVGPLPIPRKSLSEENLTAALHQALNDKQMRKKAAAVGQHLQEENGVTRAVHLIESYFDKKKPASLISLKHAGF